jgi:GT2 family glycosyltransferase
MPEDQAARPAEADAPEADRPAADGPEADGPEADGPEAGRPEAGAAVADTRGTDGPVAGARPDTAAPVLSVLVVSYNTRAMTLACLASLERETRMPHETIVWDNASTDGSADAIAAAFPPGRFPQLRLIRSAENLGFAGANNAAAVHATGRYLLLLNPDTVVLDGAVDRLLAFAAALPHARIWGGRTLFADMSLNPTSCWQRPTLWNTFCRTAGLAGLLPRSPFFNAEAYGGWDRGSVRAVDHVSGCLFLIERPFWEDLGGFDLDYFMYGEETDLCLRAKAMGADPHVTPEATIVHHGSASMPGQAEKMLMLLRAKVELVKRHLPPWQRPLGLALLRLWPLSRLLAARARGLVSRTPEAAAAREMWATVWTRRAVWRDGY